MSFYDDLGIQIDASPEHIRESYHALARLLHPDQQQDAGLRIAAETQMRRINQGYAVLGDVGRRRRYDSELMLTGLRNKAPVILRPLRPIKKTSVPFRLLAWATVVIACCGLTYWFLNQGPSGIGHAPVGIQDDVPYPIRPHVEDVSAPPTASRLNPRETIALLRKELQIVRAQRDAALAETRDAGASKMSMDEQLPMEPAQNVGDSANVTGTGFAGFWVYSRPKKAVNNPAFYPPDFIETSIVEHDGTVRGKYHARYNISDHAISPDVNFQFQGRVTDSSLQTLWTGDGGSKGEVEIKLLSNTEMEVNWRATKRGRSLALLNGTAVLMRRQE